MSAMSDALEVLVRDHLFGSSTWSKPSALYIALSTASISDSATGSSGITEPSGSGYSRQQLDPSSSNWDVSSSTSGATSNLSAVTFTASGGNWGSVTHVAIVSASSGGTMYLYGALTSAKTINDGDSLTFPIASLVCTFA